MAITGKFRQQVGTAKVFKASGGDAAITFASLATTTSDSTGARQSVKADFQSAGSGSDCASQLYNVFALFSWLTTAPTTKAAIDIFLNPSGSATAGTDNCGGCSGADAAYTGDVSDISVSTRGLLYCGSYIVSALAGTDMRRFVGQVKIPKRYGSIVVWNRSGRLLHSTEGNMMVEFVPMDPTSDAS